MEKNINPLFFAIGSLVSFLFGEINGLFYAFVAFVALDYITGLIGGVINKNLSSELSYKGLLKKALLFIIVAVANIIDVHVLGSGSLLKTAILFMFIANEGISLLENAANMGVPVPKKLIDVLIQLRLKGEKENADTDKPSGTE